VDPVPVDRPATLLVRRATGEVIDPVRRLLLSQLQAGELDRLAAGRQVLVLADVASAPDAAPLGAVAFDVDTGRRVARLRAIAVTGPLRHRGLGRRLLEGALTLLRSEGLEAVEAEVTAPADAEFLTAVGFEPGNAESQPQFVYRL
jgi:N-acetylglutamate synthase-like GNAT family acetyltransferase